MKQSGTVRFLILGASLAFFAGAVLYWYYVHQRTYKSDLYLNEMAGISGAIKDYWTGNGNLPLKDGRLILISSPEFTTVFNTLNLQYCLDCVYYQKENHYWILGNIPYGKQCEGTKREVILPDGSKNADRYSLNGQEFNCWMGK